MRGRHAIVAAVFTAGLQLAAPTGAFAGAATCTGVAGVDQLLAPGVVVLVGEVHGTVQSPAFVSGLACNALGAGFPVTVALEIPVTEAALVDAFLASDGADAARTALVAGPPSPPTAAAASRWSSSSTTSVSLAPRGCRSNSRSSTTPRAVIAIHR